MKKRYWSLFCGTVAVLLCILNNAPNAHAEIDKQYIVEFVDNASLFGLRQNDLTVHVVTARELEEYVDAGIVQWYEEDYEVELLDATLSGDFTLQNDSGTENLKWDLSMIHANKSKDLLCSGQGINVGIIDSGIIKHPDLIDNIKPGFNYITSTNDVTDNIGHGTFVGGLIAANENHMGIVGVADETNLIPLKCFDTNVKTTVSTICLAIKDAVDVYECDIINMSLGVQNYSQKLEEHIKYATDAGVIVIAAVGNKGSDVLYYPAACEKVIGVGSVGADYAKSTFSQYNHSVDFVAPGEDVWSTSNDGAYSIKRGTSFSTPLVTGLVASMLSADNTLTYEEIMDIATRTATIRDEWIDDTSHIKSDYYGYGLINVAGCLDSIAGEHTYFISPLACESTKTQAVIVNNSDTNFEGYCMWGEYTERGLQNMDWDYVNVSPGDTTLVDTSITSNKIKCFLWRSIEDISVISDFRETEAN